jgi:hypothetical protein
MFDCEVKFLLGTKLIDSKNYDNSKVFCLCCCGYEVVYYYLFENQQCLKYELKSSLFLVIIMSKVSEIATKAKESLLYSLRSILFFPDLNKIMKFNYFDVHFEVIPRIDKRPFYFIIMDAVHRELVYGR